MIKKPRRPFGSSLIRTKCLYEGCNNLQYFHGYLRGQRCYGKYCNKHRKGVWKDGYSFKNEKSNINNDKCSLCGWDKGPCDRHRLDNTKGYFPENVKVLCPNCHRLVTLGIISI